MSVFNFKPSPDLATREQLTTTWENGFNDAQIADIIRIGEALTLNDAVVGGQQQGEDISHIRKSKTSWIKLND